VVERLLHRLSKIRESAPRVYWLVWWGTLVNRLGGFVVPLLTIYLTTQRHASVMEAGAIVSFFGAGQVAASIIGGQLTDRVGRRATMLISLFGGAIAMALLGGARDLTDITVLVTAVGFVGELYRPAVSAVVTDVVPPAQRLYAFGLLYWAVNLGFAFAGSIGGLIADSDFSILFYADALTSAGYGVIVLLAVPETKPARVVRAASSTGDSPWLDRQFMIFIGLNFLSTLMPMQTAAPLSAHMTWQGFAPSTYGLILAANGILIIALQPIVTRHLGRFDPSKVLAVSALLYGAGMALHGVATIAIAHVGAVAIWTIAEIMESPTKSAITANMSPASARGRYAGAMVMSWGLAQIVAPRLGTWLWQDEGPSVLWNGCLVLGVVVAALLLITAPGRRRRLAMPVDTSGRFPV